ncbi:SH3 domain-containing protein [Bythopirellula polymerisocia]|nr:SH3 domain-containing protein [Bythopirellula polymerisocia]
MARLHLSSIVNYIPAALTRCISCLAIALALSSSAQCEVTFPYVAYISVPQTFARGGPGQEYYPTLQLPQGHAVEVYRHDSEGWCAVRPPEGSFCWIAAHEIHRLDNNTAEIAVESAIARVGSSVSPARSAVQVLLHRGEQLQLLPSAANDDPRWIRIAPPAGEFRWIAASSLSRTPPLENSGPVQHASGWMRQSPTVGHASGGNSSERGFAHLVQNTVPVQPAYPGAAALPSTPLPIPNGIMAASTGGAADSVELVAGSPSAKQVSQSPGLVPPSLAQVGAAEQGASLAATRVSTAPRIRFGNSPSVLGPATDRVEELQLRLSQAVIRPKEEWQFDQLESEANALLDKSDSVSEREHLRDLLDRIARFKRVQEGLPTEPTMAVNSGPDPEKGEFTGQTSRVRQLADLDLKSDDPFENRKPSADEPRYDAVGRLKPVTSTTQESPRYALVDDKGAVISFVTPTPDLNLQPYVGMRIGVNGSRGFMPEYRKAHVTAGRVTLIEDRIRR